MNSYRIASTATLMKQQTYVIPINTLHDITR